MIYQHTIPLSYYPTADHDEKKYQCLKVACMSMASFLNPGKAYTIVITDREYDVGNPVLFREYKCIIEVTECPNEIQT